MSRRAKAINRDAAQTRRERGQIVAGWAGGGRPDAEVQPASWAAPVRASFLVGDLGGPTATPRGPSAITATDGPHGARCNMGAFAARFVVSCTCPPALIELREQDGQLLCAKCAKPILARRGAQAR